MHAVPIDAPKFGGKTIEERAVTETLVITALPNASTANIEGAGSSSPLDVKGKGRLMKTNLAAEAAVT